MSYAEHSTERNDIVFHGDNSARFGIDAKQFESQPGLAAFNLETDAFVGWRGWPLIFERYLQSHSKPRLLVMCVNPLPIVGELKSDFYVNEERVLWNYGSGSEDLRPVHKQPYRDYTREGVLNVYGTLFPASWLYQDTYSIDRRKGAAWMLREFEPSRGSILLNGCKNEPLPPRKEILGPIPPEKLELFEMLLTVAREHNIRVVLRRNAGSRGMRRYFRRSQAATPSNGDRESQPDGQPAGGAFLRSEIVL